MRQENSLKIFNSNNISRYTTGTIADANSKSAFYKSYLLYRNIPIGNINRSGSNVAVDTKNYIKNYRIRLE
jgi:hypothetical protein